MADGSSPVGCEISSLRLLEPVLFSSGFHTGLTTAEGTSNIAVTGMLEETYWIWRRHSDVTPSTSAIMYLLGNGPSY